MGEIINKNRSFILLFLAILAVVIGILLLEKADSIQSSEEVVISNFEEKDKVFEEEKRRNLIKVDVGGAVKNPGVYELEEGQIVNDAILAAGGFSDEANLDFVEQNINKAKRVTDGEKIYIPQQTDVLGASEVESGYKSAGITDKININTGSLNELDSLPGIGPSYAQKIIEGRPYSKIEDIKKVSGIGISTFEKIKDLITV